LKRSHFNIMLIPTHNYIFCSLVPARLYHIMSSTANQKKKAAWELPALQSSAYLFTRNFWVQAAVLVAVAVGFYANTLKNEYALDDDIVIRQNTFVQKGFGGIGEILTNDAYKSFYQSMGVEQQLAGGRYRPLSIVSFAIEQGLFGECYGERFEFVRDRVLELQRKANITADEQKELNKLIEERLDLDKKITAENLALAPLRHGFQIAWYALLLVVLLVFLRECVFRTNTEIAFISVLLFAMHPIHTEVVANVKSRDEIFSMLFIALTFISFFRYVDTRVMKHLLLGALWFFLALLSKEYALALLGLLPLALFIFRRQKAVYIQPMLAIGAVLVLYGAMRFSSVGMGQEKTDRSAMDPLNEPYMFAKSHEVKASKLNRLDDYLVLLLVPAPLSADYSYQHFPYSDFSDWQVWLSFLIYAGLVVLMIRLIMRKHEMGFAIAFYLGFFALVCNIFMDIGATMGERLIFHSSLGFTMALAWGIVWLANYLKNAGRFVPAAMVVAIGLPYAWTAIDRNPYWKNDFTLFTHDVTHKPNSALCNGNSGAQYMNKALVHVDKNKDSVMYWSGKALPYLQKATELHPRYVNSWLNLGLCYYHRGDMENAALCWGNAQSAFRNNPILLGYVNFFKNPAGQAAVKKDYATASYWYRLAATANPGDAGLWADYAGSSFMAMKFEEAEKAFQRAANEDQTAQSYGEASRINAAMIGNGFSAAHANDSLMKLWKADSLNPDRNISLANSLMNTNEFYPRARVLLNRALATRPGDANARMLLDSITARERRMPKAK
jgi:protein O-mannosyl-transferase